MLKIVLLTTSLAKNELYKQVNAFIPGEEIH